MKSTKKFKLKQIGAYASIAAVLGASAAGIGVAIKNNTESTLLLKGRATKDIWDQAFEDKDVLAGKTKFYPAFDEKDGKLYINDKYHQISTSDSFAISATRHPDVKRTGMYVTNGFRIDTGDKNTYEALDQDGTTQTYDHDFSKLIGYKDNFDFIDQMNKLLAKQTSSVILEKNVKIRVETSDSPFYPDMENDSGLGVGTNSLGETSMISTAFTFKSAILDFTERYASSINDKPINKLANKILTSLPSTFPQSHDLHSFLLKNKTEVQSWMAQKINVPGIVKEITFGDYLGKAVLYNTVYQILQKSFSNDMTQNIDIQRKYAGDNLPDTLKNIYAGLAITNGKSLGTTNSAGYMAKQSAIDAINNLVTFESAGEGRTTGKTGYSIVDPSSFNNLIGSASSSKRWMFDGAKFSQQDVYSTIPTYTSDNRYIQGWRYKYDRTYVNQKGLVLTPQIKSVKAETIIQDPSKDQATAIGTLIGKVKEAAAYLIATPKGDKADAANKLIGAFFDGPVESRPSNEEISKISYDKDTNKITADLNVPSKVYFQSLFNNLHDGVTGDKNVDQLTKALDKRFTPLLWNNASMQEKTELDFDSSKPATLLKDIDGKDIAGSDITISLVSKENVKVMADKAADYLYTTGTTSLNPTIFKNASIYQQAEKFLIQDLIKNKGGENQLTEESKFTEGSYYKLDNNGDIVTNADGTLAMNQEMIGSFTDNILTSYGRSIVASELTIATLKLDSPEEYNYSSAYLDDLNQLEIAGKKVIDPTTGSFYEEFANDSYELLKYLNKEDDEVIAGVTTLSSKTSNNIYGYQMLGHVPSGTSIKSIKIGGHELGVHMLPNTGQILDGPGIDSTKSRTLDKALWISDAFNAGNYDNSIITAPKSEGIDEHKYKLEIIEDDGKDTPYVPTQTTGFGPQWSDYKGYFAASSMPYALTSEANQIYVSVFDNRKGV